MLKLDHEKFTDFSRNYYINSYHHHRLVYDAALNQVVGRLIEDIASNNQYIHVEIINEHAYLYYFDKKNKIYFEVNESGEIIKATEQTPKAKIKLDIKDDTLALSTKNMFLRVDRKGRVKFNANRQQEWETLTLGNLNFLDKQLTVIVNTKNSENTLQQLFESIINNSTSSVGIIFIVNPSNDNSLTLVREFQKNYNSRVDYYQVSSEEKIVSRNLAISLLQSEWFTFIEADDFYSTNYFSHITPLLNDDSIGLIATNSQIFDTILNKYKCHDPHAWRFKKSKISLYKNELENYFIYSLHGLIFRVSTIQENKINFNERLKHYSGALFSNYYLLER